MFAEVADIGVCSANFGQKQERGYRLSLGVLLTVSFSLDFAAPSSKSVLPSVVQMLKH